MDIGVTDVTKNSRLFTVASTTCSMLLKLVAVFSPPIDIRHALGQHTQSVSVPIRHPSDTSSVYSQASRQTYIYIANTQQDTRYIRAILLRVASVGCFPGAWRWGSWHFQVIKHGPLSASHYFSFLSKRSGRRMSPRERIALYILPVYCTFFFFGGIPWELPWDPVCVS